VWKHEGYPGSIDKAAEMSSQSLEELASCQQMNNKMHMRDGRKVLKGQWTHQDDTETLFTKGFKGSHDARSSQ